MKVQRCVKCGRYYPIPIIVRFTEHCFSCALQADKENDKNYISILKKNRRWYFIKRYTYQLVITFVPCFLISYKLGFVQEMIFCAGVVFGMASSNIVDFLCNIF